MKKTPTELFLEGWDSLGIGRGDMCFEHRFHPIRRWRFDIAFPSRRVAIEIDGRGRHQTITGVGGDCEKDHVAATFGWTVLHLPTTYLTGKDSWGEPLLGKFLEEILIPVLNQKPEYYWETVDGTHYIQAKKREVPFSVEKLPNVSTPQGSEEPCGLSGNDSSKDTTDRGSTRKGRKQIRTAIRGSKRSNPE